MVVICRLKRYKLDRKRLEKHLYGLNINQRHDKLIIPDVLPPLVYINGEHATLKNQQRTPVGTKGKSMPDRPGDKRQTAGPVCL